ncbi:S-adenosyl-L-methionine-dependent methyltransferase [Colletotrichum cereale]|nr:S-adenosyl-L-methionine-dependent methyltransferase [Colletotrichum cereale]
MDELPTPDSPEQSLDEVSGATPSSESFFNDADEIESFVPVQPGDVHYQEILGRDYVTCDGMTYWRPCDPEHFIFDFLITAGSYQEPTLVNPQKVLDIGAGAGIWAIEFADKHPSASVIGTDVADKIAPISVPPNLEILIEDCTKLWSFKDAEFDFIHARELIGAIKNWKALFAEAYRCLKPGKWFETIEPSFRIENRSHTIIPADNPLRLWESFFVESGKKRGTSFAILEEDIQRRAMVEVGFIDIQEQELKVSGVSIRWPP